MAGPKRPPDPEATQEENAARIVDNAADLYLDRVLKLETTLRSNVTDLSDYKRRQTATWLKRVNDRLIATVDENGGLTPLGLSEYPEME
jgi:hypothetical protein